jgi:tetratricopeptide (TPR) repeat protein
MQFSLLGNVTASQASRASGEERRRLSRESIEHYRKAVEAYDQKGIQPPPLILNNLAWLLAEDDDEALRAEALTVAARGKALVPNPERMANMHDTYAWTLYKNGKLLEAEKAFRDLIALVDLPTFRCHLARVLLDLRKFDDALVEVRKARGAVKDFPERGEALRLEAEIREARRQAIGE